MSNIIDLTGQKIGKLEVLKRKRENNRTYYYCKCECGNEKWIRADALGENKLNNCGCDRVYHYRDLTNQRFGMLTVIEIVGMSLNNGHVWRCKCDCGKFKDIPMSNLISGATISCGCYQKSVAKKYTKKAAKAFKEKNLIDDTNVSSLNRESPIKSNTSGVTGVALNKRNQKWLAFINFKKKRYYLGYYTEKEDAIKARKEAEEKIHGEFLKWYEKEIINK